MSELLCQQTWCRGSGAPRVATAAIDTGGFTGEMPGLACDECAVRKMMSAPGLGYQVISIDQWRQRVQPVLEDAMEQLKRAKTPIPALPQGSCQPGPAALTPAHSHRARVSPVRRILAIGSGLGLVVGTILIVEGNSINYQGAFTPSDFSATSGDPLIGVGIFLVVASLLYLVGRIIYELAKVSAAGRRQYKTWMAGLTPEQRMAVHLGEAAVLAEVHHKLHEHNKAQSEKIADNVMHGGSMS